MGARPWSWCNGCLGTTDFVFFVVNAEDPIPEELLQLLRRRRVLVILDHFSELHEATRKEIRPGHPEFPVNAFVVTSRLEEQLDGVPKTTIRPLR